MYLRFLSPRPVKAECTVKVKMFGLQSERAIHTNLQQAKWHQHWEAGSQSLAERAVLQKSHGTD